MAYLWFKTLHVVAVVAWMSGLFYVGRIVVNHVEALEYGAAHRTAALLLALSFVVLGLVYALQRRPFFRAEGR